MRTIAQTVYDVCELSRTTNIPFLLISNPGYGKTTGLRNFAQKNGYHVEAVIGSRSTPEELLGYQVNNGGEALEHLDSQWWKRIQDKEAEGIHSILFCDEISTCSPQVQGSMLSLIFDRMNNKGEKLPESCIIIAAANYAKNLPNYMDIMAPTINRFCVVNLTKGMSGIDITREIFHRNECEAVARKLVALSDESNTKYNEKMEELFNSLFVKYSDKHASIGYLDINNSDLANLYQDADDVLYNVLSLRSMANFIDLTKKCIEFNITDDNFIEKVVDGMIGKGTNNFKEPAQEKGYREILYSSVKSIIKQITSGNKVAENKKTFNFGEKTVSNIVAKLNTEAQALTSLVSSDNEGEASKIDELNEVLTKDYGNYAEALFRLDGNKEEQTKFVSDYESVATFFMANKDKYQASKVIDCVSFLQKFDAYYGQLAGKKALPDVNKQKMFKDFQSSLYMCSLIAVKPGYSKDDVAKQVKLGNIIEVGVRRLTTAQLYKISYGTSVYTNQMGTPVDSNYSALIFENGKLVEVSQLTLAELNR